MSISRSSYRAYRRVAGPGTSAAALLSAGVCIYFAFLGSQHVNELLSSVPMLVVGVFIAVVVVLIAELFLRLAGRKGYGVPAACLGAVLILAGGLLGSEPLARWWSYRFGGDRPRDGYLVLDATGPRSELIRSTGGMPGRLPFAIGMERFSLEHYGPDILDRLPAGAEPDGAPVRSLSAEVRIWKDNEVVDSGVVRANRPLRYGGYFFYLHRWDDPPDTRQVVLRVQSARGSGLVYAGIFFLLLGVCWRCWVEPLPGRGDQSGRKKERARP